MAKTLDQAVRNRIKDDMAGIREGRVDLNVGKAPASEPLPTLADLALPLAIRRKLETLTASHVELGQVAKEAEKSRDEITKTLKGLLAEHVGDETPSVYIGPNKVSRYWQDRASLDKDTLRDTLLALGVKPQIVSQAFDAATTVTKIETLRVTAPGGE